MAKKDKIFIIEYKNIFGEIMQFNCIIEKQFDKNKQKDELFFIDMRTGYKIHYSKSLIKEAINIKEKIRIKS